MLTPGHAYDDLPVRHLEVEFRVDTSGPQAARAKVDWNSKKAGVSLDYLGWHHCVLRHH